MTYETIKYERRGRVAVITYDRQERRNAWSVPMYRETVRAIEAANADDEVAAIVITHEGPVYCAGTDFKAAPEPPDPKTGRSPNIAMISMQQDESWLHILARSKPSIGAIGGLAMGLGMTQILPFDLRIGGESSTYAFPFLKLGVMPELGCTALLPRLVGYGRALQLCLLSRTVSAVEAERMGLISEVVPDDQVLTRALEVGEMIAGYPKLQTRLTRELFWANAGEFDTNVLLQREVDAFIKMFKARKAAASA